MHNHYGMRLRGAFKPSGVILTSLYEDLSRLLSSANSNYSICAFLEQGNHIYV